MTANIEVVTMPIGRTSLVEMACRGELQDWYGEKPRGAADWRGLGDAVSADFGTRDWLAAISPALDNDGPGREALERCAGEGGVVVTTGQQPGLFGGPLYVIHKALSVIALARSLESATGRCTVPLFWAATDDADFAEARKVGVIVDDSHPETLLSPEPPIAGLSMAATPLGDVSAELLKIIDASRVDSGNPIMSAVARAYTREGATVGSAYLELLRSILGPLGVPVLDAAHVSVRTAGAEVMKRALARGAAVSTALAERSERMRERRYRPQVADVPALTLVFRTAADGTRDRVPVAAAQAASNASASELGANVLLRPVLERYIVPTVAYVGGPGEIAYFAQVSAVADAIDFPRPRIVPRWSGVIVEPRVREALDRIGASIDDLRDPHAMETRIARASLAPGVRSALDTLRHAISGSVDQLKGDESTGDALARSVGSMAAVMTHRISRLERRYAAAIKREGTELLHEASIARANLFPSGAPQERTLSFIPFLARHGETLTKGIDQAATEHAEKLVTGG